MKKIILSLLTILIIGQASAQSLDVKPDPNAPYLKDKNLPAFTFPFIAVTWISLYILSIPQLAMPTVSQHFVDIQE